jgi:hypothetical protein
VPDCARRPFFLGLAAALAVVMVTANLIVDATCYRQAFPSLPVTCE